MTLEGLFKKRKEILENSTLKFHNIFKMINDLKSRGCLFICELFRSRSFFEGE